MWTITHKYDHDGARLADGHYSRRTIGSPQFMPPGETLILVTPTRDAIWGWWRPHPRACAELGMRAHSGLGGWTCSIFRNPDGTGIRSSDLVLAAELELLEAERRGDLAGPCGPDGMMSWVWPRKLPRSQNPGWCFQVAGWTRGRWSAASQGPARRKRLLVKPIELAGVQACAWRPGIEFKTPGPAATAGPAAQRQSEG